MRVSQRLDYALRASVMLAARSAGTYVAAGEIAEALMLPRRFVEQQITELARAGVVECRRGASGGCALARPADEITMGDVVRAVQGEVLDVPRSSGSAAAESWQGAADALEEYLDSVTLEQVLLRQRQMDALAAPMYYI